MRRLHFVFLPLLSAVLLFTSPSLARNVWAPEGGAPPLQQQPRPHDGGPAAAATQIPSLGLFQTQPCPGGVVDVCGVCNGTNNDPAACRRGCDGVWSSGLEADSCGICNGTGSTCECTAKRWVAWAVFLGFITLAPVFLFAMLRLCIFVVEPEPGWAMLLYDNEVTQAGHGAFRTKIAQDARHNAWVHTLIWSVITWIVVAIRFIFDWTSPLSVICDRIYLGYAYSTVILGILAAAALVATGRWAYAVRSARVGGMGVANGRMGT